MRKRLKLKKRKQIKTIKYIIFFALICFSFIFPYKHLNKVNLYISNEDFLIALLNKSNHHIKYENNILIKLLDLYLI